MLRSHQFAGVVEQRHNAGGTFSAGEIESMSPEEYRVLLDEVARRQRAEPERAMLEAQQRSSYAGVYTHLLEHIGDISHRLNEEYATHGGVFNPEYPKEKVRRTLHIVENKYGVGREIEEQRQRNLEFHAQHDKHVPTDEEDRQLREAYTRAHEELPAYNRPTMLAREAAASLGAQRYDDTRLFLRSLQRVVDDPVEYQHAMSQQGAAEWMRAQRG